MPATPEPGPPFACLSEQTLFEFVEGRPSPALRARVDGHVARCAACRTVLSVLAEAQGDADARAPEAEPAPSAEPATEPAPGGGAYELGPGARVDRYVVLSRVGEGGMGVVYAAFDPELNRKIALKLLRSELGGSEARGHLDERLRREAQAMARLAHPNVAAVYDVGHYGDRAFVAIEFVEGTTLARWLERTKPSARAVLEHYAAAGRGLSAAHAAGLVHRDFKPQNVLVGDDGRVLVVDFGLARLAEAGAEPGEASGAAPEGPPLESPSDLTATGALLGTPAYMAPEQHKGLAADARSDQFSFCVALYEALYAQRPFKGATRAELVESIRGGKVREPPSPGAAPARVHRALLRGLSADPEKRFASMNELLAAIAFEPKARRRRVAAALGAAAALAALVQSYRLARTEGGRPTCEGAERKLAGVWDDGRKAAILSSFLGTNKPFAEDAFRGVERALDGYARDWAAARKDACEATHRRGEQSAEMLDLRMACLDERLKEVSALTEVFSRADAGVVVKAVTAAEALGPLGPCADAKALALRFKPPADAALALKVSTLRSDLARSKVLGDAGQYREALAVAGQVAAAAETLERRPLWGEALRQQGSLQGLSGDAKGAVASLRRAVTAADAAGDDATRAEAWAILLFYGGAVQADYELAPLMNEQSMAALARMGGDVKIDAARRTNLAAVFVEQGRLDDAQREYEGALAVAERAFGPDSRQALACLHGLGNVETDRGNYAAAWEKLRLAYEISERTVGPRHPRGADLLANLGVVLVNQLRFAEALDYATRALTVARDALGEDSPKSALYLNNVGAILNEQGHYERALPHLLRALELVEGQFGPRHAALVHPLSGLGEAYLGSGDRRKAVSHLERAVGLPESAEAALDLAQAKFALARALSELGRDPRRARALALAARDAFRDAGKGPLDAHHLALVERWLGR